ncbi:MAG: cytochrome C [Betaproteobacteria bacterium]
MSIAPSRVSALVRICVPLLLSTWAANAAAVPSFARQTGQECIACHVSFPELTPYGRYFKLTGYTIGKTAISKDGFNFVPLAVMAQASITHTQNNKATDPETGETTSVNQRNNGVVFSGASLFLAGKVTDYAGGFIQWSYDNLATTANGTLGGHSGIDNTDLRVVGRYSAAGAAEPDLIYGATLNNNPTSQDVWNSTPAFGFPYTASPLASTPAAATLIDGGLGQQAAGMGGYVFWKKTIYGELSYYRTADGAFSILRAGQDFHTDGGVAALKGYNPYWRLAYSHDWGANSIMVGTYGMIAERYPSNIDTSTGTDRFRDVAVDAQYQYITDPHTFTTQATYIREKQSWNTSYQAMVDTGSGIGAGPTPANPSDTLNTFKIKGTYYHDRKYGATVAYFSTTGSADGGLYGTNDDGSARKPDSNGYVVELDYLPIQYVRLMLQYTGYNKFNGSSTNYDGTGRNAHDNNTLFLNLWVAY